MKNLGFYVDIMGIGQDLLSGNDGRVMSLIYALGNELHRIGVYAADQNLARFFIYQMGDGFMVHFDNVKFKESENCLGDVNSMANLAISLSYRFLIKHNGILKIALAEGDFFGMSQSGFKFIENNSNGNNGYRCRQGLIFILPISGVLLAKAYRLINLDKSNKPFKPATLIHSDLYKYLSGEMKKNLIKKAKKDLFWWSYDIKRPHLESVARIYKEIWSEKFDRAHFLKSLEKYNAKL